MKLVRYVVEGANFLVFVTVDEDVFTDDGTAATNAYLEAATRTLENIFRHGPDHSESFGLRMKQGEEPAIGIIMSVCKDGEIGDNEKLCFVKSAVAAQNAGCLELVRHFEKFE